ncbi:MAG: hypothetical protein Q6J68_03870 [Thermostichales cyanobacterium SZTDM-1c_bins_54]
MSHEVVGMQGSVAQMIALTVWGNGALQGQSGYDEAGFYPENPAFRCCEYVRFGDPDHETASDPVGWLGWLRGEGVRGLQMIYGGLEKAEDNRLWVVFAGQNQDWLLEAVKATTSDYWGCDWQLGDRRRRDGKLWQVTYRRLLVDGPRAAMPMAAEEVKERLIAHLPKMADFAYAHREERFARIFEIALDCLTADPRPKNDSSLLPPPAEQLLHAAQTAWVFGGMGSWNDMSFAHPIQLEYEALSSELYRLLNLAIMAAVNSSLPPPT